MDVFEASFTAIGQDQQDSTHGNSCSESSKNPEDGVIVSYGKQKPDGGQRDTDYGHGRETCEDDIDQFSDYVIREPF